MNISVNKERLINEFTELVSVDSESFNEREMADILTEKLKKTGFEVYEDNAGEYNNGTAGNIYGYLQGTKNSEPVLFSSHMDTVFPGKNKKAVINSDGKITSDGNTVLGADDAAGIVEILEGIRSVREAGIPHRPIEILFSIGEEVYLKGTDKFNFGRIKSKQAYVLDMSGDVGSAAIKAPSIISFTVTVNGKAAHAGFAPENGIHAIEIVSRSINNLKQEHIDDETTFNIGTISGGVAANIVPEKCTISKEIRSYNHEKAIKQIEHLKTFFSDAVKDTGANFELNYDIHIESYNLNENEPVIKNFLAACKNLGIEGSLNGTFGGSDNHNLIKHGISGIVLSCGMYNVHSVSEYTKIDELIKGAELVAQIII